jgi:hypothetical protein
MLKKGKNVKFPRSERTPRCKGSLRKELDGLESVPRLLFLWNRRPRIAAANPQHHVERHSAVETMALTGHLSGTRVLVLPVFRKNFGSIQIPQGNDLSSPENGHHFAAGDKRSVISVVFFGRTTTRLDQSEKRLCE